MRIYGIHKGDKRYVYIGQAILLPDLRGKSARFVKWAFEQPNFQVDWLESCSSREQLNEREKFWIKHFQNEGHPLLNYREMRRPCLSEISPVDIKAK